MSCNNVKQVKVKETVFALYAGLEVYNNLQLSNPGIKADIGIQNKKGDIKKNLREDFNWPGCTGTMDCVDNNNKIHKYHSYTLLILIYLPDIGKN